MAGDGVDAKAFAPPSAYVREREGQVQVARFDVVVLVETTSPSAAREVQATAAYQTLLGLPRGATKRVHVLAARRSSAFW